MITIRTLHLLGSKKELETLPKGKLLINTINAFSYNNARHDILFEEALTMGDVLIPDGISIVKACSLMHTISKPKERVTGWDLFIFEMNKLEQESKAEMERLQGVGSVEDFVPKKVFFMGSSAKVLKLIKSRASREFPHLQIITYSPPYKTQFTVNESMAMVEAINKAQPDLLWIGMTAPKQEKWTYAHWHELNIDCHCGTIGAVFDFFAGTYKRAPDRWQKCGLEWLYRLVKEPKRLWRRYILGNMEFIILVIREKLGF